MRKTKELEQRIIELEQVNRTRFLEDRLSELMPLVGKKCEYFPMYSIEITPINFVIKDDKVQAVTKDGFVDFTNRSIWEVEPYRMQSKTNSDLMDKIFGVKPDYDRVIKNAANIHMKNFDLDKFKKSHKRMYKMIVHIIENGK